MDLIHKTGTLRQVFCATHLPSGMTDYCVDYNPWMLVQNTLVSKARQCIQATKNTLSKEPPSDYNQLLLVQYHSTHVTTMQLLCNYFDATETLLTLCYYHDTIMILHYATTALLLCYYCASNTLIF